MEILKTERLIIRRLRREDIEDFAALCGDPKIMRYMDDGLPLSREKTESWIEVSLNNYRERGWGCFAVAEKSADGMIGFAGFARSPDKPGVVELIYAFSPKYWGRGYATEIAAALITFGFESCGLARLEATVIVENEASKRVLEKVGMRYEERKAEEDSLVDYYAVERARTGELTCAKR